MPPADWMPDRVEPSSNEQPLQPRRLAQVIAVVGGEAFGSAEKGLNAGAFQRRYAVERLFQDRLEMIEIVG